MYSRILIGCTVLKVSISVKKVTQKHDSGHKWPDAKCDLVSYCSANGALSRECQHCGFVQSFCYISNLAALPGFCLLCVRVDN